MDQSKITTESVIAWARSKEPDAIFKFTSNRNCFFAQYLRDVHGVDPHVSTTTFWLTDDPVTLYDLPDAVGHALSLALSVTPDEPNAFGPGQYGKPITFHTVADYMERAA